ncbi:Uncharacterised protein [Shigella sonnei]|nr:Uncharacterised protein [Shigella sonnei]
MQGRREGEAENDCGQSSREGTQQIEEQNRADIGFLPMLVVSNRCHHQHQHQDGGNGFQCADEQST